MIALFLSVPVACFRAPHAREYLETLPCPPPSTVYGALLALIGETARTRHAGAEIALANLVTPARSVILRTVWRVKDAALGPGLAENKRPDFQELLSGVRLAVWIRSGGDEPAPTLEEKIASSISAPALIERFGALALGESTHLVDELRLLLPTDGQRGQFLVRDTAGALTLPLWPDHVGSAATRWVQCRLEERAMGEQPDEDCWVGIRPN